MKYASELTDFPDLLRAVADKFDVPAWIVEKDYYVTRALHALQHNIGDQFLFKGGTSLSKGWGLIERFSEDIDLLFRTEQNGKPIGARLRHRRFKDAEEILVKTPGFALARLDKPLSSETGMHRESRFTYPATQKPIVPVSDLIRLEMNCRGGTHPQQTRKIQSLVADFVAGRAEMNLADDLTSFSVACLDVTRTFIEKLFAAYAAFNEDRALGRARHYYDLYQLAELTEINTFIAGDEFAAIFEDVRRFSVEHWPEKALPDDMNFTQYNAFRPTEPHLAELTRNYSAERVLFFREPPTIKEILERLQSLPVPVKRIATTSQK